MSFLRATLWLESLWLDLRFALRQLLQAQAFTAVAIATLALGIGVNTAVFTVTNAALFKGFPHVDPDNRILYIGSGRGEVSYPDFEDWRKQARSFEGMAVVSNGGLRIGVSEPSGSRQIYDGTELSVNAFQVLGRKPILGRDFADADANPGSAPVVILSYGFWAQHYRENPDIIGQTVRLNGAPTTIIGVMPRGFDFPHHRVDLWLPLRPTPDLQRRQFRVLWFAFGRMVDGFTTEKVRAEMQTIGRRLEMAYPQTNRSSLPVVMDFREFFMGPNATVIYGSMWGAVGFLLLIVCANLASLLMTRATGRSREMSVRIALGAGRWRIVRQLLIESLMLSIAGGVVAWWIATSGVRAYEMVATPPGSYEHWDYTADHRVFAYLVMISVAAGLLFGLAPANLLSKLDVNAALKGGGRGVTGRRGRYASTALVTGEVALAVVLLAGAGVMVRTFLNIYTADLGVKENQIITASVVLPAAKYPGPEAQIAFFDQLTGRLAAIPGVESVALADGIPGLYAPRLRYEVASARGADEQPREVSALIINPDYFRTVGASVLSGRAFTDDDRASAVPVMLVNERFASQHWPGENPVGKHVRLFTGTTPGVWRSVVGVVSNIVQNDKTGQNFEPVVYLPFREKLSAGIILARTRVPPRSLVTAFRREIQAADSDLVIGSGYGSLEGPAALTESLAFHYWSKGVNGGLFLVFAAIAFVIASMGLYAVIAHSVSERTQEIGIRMAVGATQRTILTLVFKMGLFRLGFGLIVGLAASVAVNRMLEAELTQVSPADPVTLIITCAVLVLSAALGCWIPARRAMRVDPVVALRHN